MLHHSTCRCVAEDPELILSGNPSQPSALPSCKGGQLQGESKGEIIPSGYSLDYSCQSIWPEKLGQLR